MFSITLVAALSNCAASFDLVGGPHRETLTVEVSEAVAQLEPRVADSDAAATALASVKRRATLAVGLGVLGAGLLGASVGIGLGRQDQLAGPLAIGLSAGALVIEILALVLRPSLGDFAEVLRLFNVNYPVTPWLSDALGLKGGLGVRWDQPLPGR